MNHILKDKDTCTCKKKPKLIMSKQATTFMYCVLQSIVTVYEYTQVIEKGHIVQVESIVAWRERKSYA